MKYFVKDNERIDEWIQIGQAIPQDDTSSQAFRDSTADRSLSTFFS